MPRIPRYDAGFWRGLARWGATRLPRWWLEHSPGPIGAGIGLAQERIRGLVRDNLRLVHGERSPVVEALDAYATLSSYAHCLAEGLAAADDDPPVFRYAVEGREHLLRARESRQGAILVTCHAGSWDVAGGVMNLRGFDLAIAMAPERDEAARRISDAARARVGVKVFHVGDDPLSALPLAQHVRGGGAVALQIDRVPPGMRTRTTTFFGRAWNVPLGPFQLAQVTGAPILPVFTARLGFLHHLVRSEAPIVVPRRGSPAEQDQAIATAMTSVERFVRRFPTQWFHFAPHPLAERATDDLVDRRAEEQRSA
jgi:lauroyl/myristoyl acyltransferase